MVPVAHLGFLKAEYSWAPQLFVWVGQISHNKSMGCRLLQTPIVWRREARPS